MFEEVILTVFTAFLKLNQFAEPVLPV